MFVYALSLVSDDERSVIKQSNNDMLRVMTFRYCQHVDQKKINFVLDVNNAYYNRTHVTPKCLGAYT